MITSPAMPSATELLPLLPELVLIGGAFALLIVDLFIDARHKVWTHFLSVLVLVVVLAMLATGKGGQGVVMNGMFVRDTAADVMKLAIVLMSGLTLVYGWSYLRERRLYRGEIPVLVLFATAGMMMLVSAGSLGHGLSGMELLALCSYALVAADRDNGKATEAAMKYIVLGSLASGLLLYGMSLVYGATGSLHLDAINAAIAGSDERTLLLTGTVFMVAGLGVQAGSGAVPHVAAGRVPGRHRAGRAVRQLRAQAGRVRHGVPPAGSGRWPAGRGVEVAAGRSRRGLAGDRQPDGRGPVQPQAHAGVFDRVAHRFPADGNLAGGDERGYAAALFYAITYALMSTAAFGAIIALSRQGFEAENIDDFKGLNARNPKLAVLVLFIMASLAGVPPFLGFWTKLAVLGAAVQGGMLWLALLGVACAVVGAYYYLRVIKVMYFDEPVGASLPAHNDRVLGVVLGVNSLGLLALGLTRNPIMVWCQRAFT